MKISGKLFELIRSMSKAEKVYFKRYTSMHVKGDENNYIRLFNAFALYDELDEKKIKKALKNSPALKYFSSSQAYLYKLLLKCLRAYHSDESPDTKTMELVLDSVFLKDRGLFEQSNNAIENARVLALENEDLVYLLKAYDTQQENAFRSPDIKALEMVQKETIPNALQLLDKIKEKIEINFLVSKAYQLYLKHGENTKDKTAITEASEILKDPLLKDNLKYLTRANLYRSFSIKSFINYVLGDYPALKKVNDAHIYAVEQDPLFNSEAVSCNYAILLCNKMIICYQFGKVEELETAFHKALSIKFESEFYKTLIFGGAYTNILNAYIRLGLVNKGLALVPETLRKLKKYEGKLPADIPLVLESYLATLYFMTGNYPDALKWANKVLNSDNNIREDIHIEVRILSILIHYELKNFQLIDSLIVSLQRFMIKMKCLDEYSKVIFKYMKKLAFIMNKKEMKEELIVFKNELTLAVENRKDKNTYIFYWIEKKLELTIKAKF